ncbi:MAG: PilN domain-containing protein [Desulfamplus sp.]|nr:PilN domain-containing protein [Desulfamplus sp.]
MIRINLLPFRAARAKENIRKQVSIFLLLLVFISLAMTYITTFVNKKIESLKSDIAQIEVQIKSYKAKADEVAKIEKALAILEQKLNVVRGLNAMRKEPVILLEAMTRLLVPEQMWITYLQISDANVVLRGVSFDNRTVADFMTNLEKSPLFKSVDLQTLQMQSMQGVTVKSFALTANKAPHENKNKEDNKENAQKKQSKKK